MPAIESPYVFRHASARVYTATRPGVDPTPPEGEELDPADAHWTQQPYLYVEKLHEAAAPDIDECQMVYHCGDFAVREKDEWGQGPTVGFFNSLAVQRHFVKVELLDKPDEDPGTPEDWTVTKTWYGVIEAIGEQQAQQAYEQFNRTGKQELTAFGLLRLLETTIIESSEVWTPQGVHLTVNRGLPFNYSAGAGTGRYGNRTTIPMAQVHIHDWLPWSLRNNPDDDEDTFWTASDAVKYLMEYHTPVDGDDIKLFDWIAGPLDDDGKLPCEWFEISVETDRRSVKSVLDELLDRRRMMGYYVYGAEEDGEFVAHLDVFTFVDEDVDLPNGESIPANPNTTQYIDGGSSTIVEDLRLRQMATHLVDRLVVEGAYYTSMFTLGVGNNAAGREELAEGWTDDQEDDYLNGAGGTADENTAARGRISLANVFSRFAIADEWPARVARDVAGEVSEYHITIDPERLPTGEIDDGLVESLFNVDNGAASDWAFHYRPIEEYLPLRDFASKESIHPFVVFLEDDGTYTLAENLTRVEGRSFSCTLKLLTETLGIRLDVNVPGAQQLIASGHWAGASETPDDLDPDNANSKSVSYDDMLLTCSVEWDEKVRVVRDLRVPTGERRTLIISIPDARVHFVLPGTVKDISADGTLEYSDGEVLRDDRERLRRIAAAAAQWYGTVRQAAIIPIRDIKPSLASIGTIVRQIWGASDDPVNTPITGVTYDLTQGKMTIETSYAELDFATVASRRAV